MVNPLSNYMRITEKLKNLKTNKLNNLIVLSVLLIAAFLRLWQLGSIPPSLTSDEASLGYNAFSILKTGRDEYGQFLPMIFKSFGDYKPGLYVYATVPFVAIFGLNEYSVRLPSAIAGVFAVYFLHLIIRKLKKGNSEAKLKTSSMEIGNWKLEILAPALLAISPWHIHFSRGAWEVNLSLTLTLAGIYFFLKALEKSKFLLLSSVFFSLTLLTYQGAKLSTAIVILILTITFWREVKNWLHTERKLISSSLIIGMVVVYPILFSFVRGETGRLEVFSVFSYPRKEADIESLLSQGQEKISSLSYYLFHSENLNFARGIMGRWFNHFSGRFLFFEGDWQNPRHSAPNAGMMLLSDLILLIVGTVSLLKSKGRKLKTFIILWLVLAPLPAVLSRDQVHAVRSLNMVIPLVIISSFGLMQLILWIKNFKKGLVLTTDYLLLTSFFLVSFIYFLDAYFVHLPKHNSKEWGYGYKQIVEEVTKNQSKYKTIKIQQSFAQPYIYFLFYQKYDPAKYQEQAQLVESEYKYDVGYIEKLDNICFCAIDFPQNKKEHGSLVVADDIRIPESELDSESVNLIKEIRYLDGNTAFRVVEVE